MEKTDLQRRVREFAEALHQETGEDVAVAAVVQRMTVRASTEPYEEVAIAMEEEAGPALGRHEIDRVMRANHPDTGPVAQDASRGGAAS